MSIKFIDIWDWKVFEIFLQNPSYQGQGQQKAPSQLLENSYLLLSWPKHNLYRLKPVQFSLVVSCLN